MPHLKTNRRKRSGGFSLLELLVVLAILGTLYSLVSPQYHRYVLRANRTEGRALLVDAAARQARYHAQNQQFITQQQNINELQLPHAQGNQVHSASGLYQLRVEPGDGGYLLQAVPRDHQRADTTCATLLLNGLGTTGNTGSANPAECWK